MNIIKQWQFVIETNLPVESGEDLSKVTIEGDTPVKDVKRAWHWFGGISLMPGTNQWKNGVFIKAIFVNIWSPYFEDAKIFSDYDEARNGLINAVGKDAAGYDICTIENSHYKETWKTKKSYYDRARSFFDKKFGK